MRLARHGAPGAERPIAAGADGVWHDLATLTPDITGAFLRDGLAAAAAALPDLPAVDEVGRFGPPVAGIGKVVCIGLNYRDHAAETGADLPGRAHRLPQDAGHGGRPGRRGADPAAVGQDRLGGRAGRRHRPQARYLDSPADSAACIAGYAISNDVSRAGVPARARRAVGQGQELRDVQPVRAVARDGRRDRRPAGAWPCGCRSTASCARTARRKDMIFAVDHLVWYLSQFLVLRPGDVINTGTPAGVAMGRPGTPYLRAGDVVELEIDGLGRQRQSLRGGLRWRLRRDPGAGHRRRVRHRAGRRPSGWLVTGAARRRARPGRRRPRRRRRRVRADVTDDAAVRAAVGAGRRARSAAWTCWSTTPASAPRAASRPTTTTSGAGCSTSTCSARRG